MGMRIRVAKSARRHRIGNAHILAAMANAGVGLPDPDSADALIFIGPDDRDLDLYMVAVPDNKLPEGEGLTVIHCEPMDWRA